MPFQRYSFEREPSVMRTCFLGDEKGGEESIEFWEEKGEIRKTVIMDLVTTVNYAAKNLFSDMIYHTRYVSA